MASYGADVATMRPIITRLFDHLETGFAAAVLQHERDGDIREQEPWFFLYQVRHRACRLLMDDGLQAMNEEGTRAQFPMSALVVHFQNLVIRVMHARPLAGSPDLPAEIPSPGRSRLRQEFWSQRTAIPELQTENLLLLWLDDGVGVRPRMTLVRPIGGSHVRQDLRIDWSGKLTRDLATLQEADLEILRPENEHLRLLRGA